MASRKIWIGITVAIIATSPLVLCSGALLYFRDSEVIVSQADYGNKWPFTVASGRLECLPGRKIVLHAADTTYALNAEALNDGRWPDVVEIMRPDSEYPGGHTNYLLIMKRANPLC